MADPVSITAGVLGILRAALSLIEVIKSHTATPQELGTLETELDHLNDVLQDAQQIATDHRHVPNILIKNMETAQDKVQQVHDFIDGRMYRAGSAHRKIRRLSLIRQAGQLKRFAQDVQSMRSHLTDCLAVSNLACTLRSPSHKTDSEHFPIPFTCLSLESKQPNQDGVLEAPDLSSWPEKTELQDCESSETLERIQTIPNNSTSTPTSLENALQNRRLIQNRTVNAVSSLVERTQHAMVSEDVSLRVHLAHMYHELGRNRLQIQRLTQNLEVFERDWRRRRSLVSRTKVKADCADGLDDPISDSISTHTESDASEVFFDCISRFSEDLSDTSVKRLQAKFSGAPDYFLEVSPTFFPEQYISNDTFNGVANLVFMTEMDSTDTHRLRKYFIIYAESPRTWRRVTVLATIFTFCQRSAFSALKTPDLDMFMYRKLPFQAQLEALLNSRQMLDTVTNISLTVTEDYSGKIAISANGSDVEEDAEEIYMSNEAAKMEDIEDMGCPQFLESEVIVLSRLAVYRYRVQVETQLCDEEKLPFASVDIEGRNEMKDFIDDLKRLNSLRECKYISRFVGVVLDDTRKHLKSYLKEMPVMSYIDWMLANAEADGEFIPWTVRETWAKQIVTAVSGVHSKGFAVGGIFSFGGIGIRPDGTIVLTAVKPSGWRLANLHGQLLPELRDSPNPTPSSPRTDLFQLGLALWLLAEHKATPIGHYCRINACTQRPRYACKAAHSNPIDLPRCSRKEVPEYFNTMISHCRKSHPRNRMPARVLLQLFDNKSPAPHLAELMAKYPANAGVLRFCDECGHHITGTPESFYFSCAICRSAPFDICQSCQSAGIHCFVAEHQLERFSAAHHDARQQG